MTNQDLQPDCQATQTLIDNSLEGDSLNQEQQGFLQAHLTQCPYCRKYELAMRNLLGSLKDLAELSPPPGLVDKIMTRVATVAAEQPAVNPVTNKVIALPKRAASPWIWGLRGLRARTMAPIAAAVMLLLVGGTLMTKLPLMNPALQPEPEALYTESEGQYLSQGGRDDFGFETAESPNLSAENLPQGRQMAAPDPYDRAMQQEGPRENTPLQNGQLMQDEGDVFANTIGLPTVMATTIMPQDSSNAYSDPEDPLAVMTGF